MCLQRAMSSMVHLRISFEVNKPPRWSTCLQAGFYNQCMTFSTKTAHDIFIILWIERLMHECKTIEYNVALLMPVRVIAVKLSLWGA